MNLLNKFRQENPAYKDIPESELAPALYNKFYKDKMTPQEFATAIVGDAPVIKKQPKYSPNKLEAGIMGAAQELTFGKADEMAGAVGGGLSFLRGDGFGRGYDDVTAQQREALEAASEQQGGAMLTGRIAGGVLGGVLGGAALAPTKLGQFLMSGGRIAQTGKIAATGAVSGGAYGFGTGEGGFEERLSNIPSSAVLGAAGGVGGAYIARGVGSLLSRKPTKEALEQAVGEFDEMVSLSGQKMSQVPSLEQMQGKSITMPKGAATGDVNLMRLEEAARQGQFGDDLQRQIQMLDGRTKTDVLNKLQGMIGKGSVDSEELLSTGIKNVKGRYVASKALQGKLMKARNEALNKTTVYKDYVNETLKKSLSDLKNDANFNVGMMRESAQPIKKDLEVLDKILKTKSNTGVNFRFLNAWRSGLNDYKVGTPEGVMAGQIKGVYDDWLDNITSDAIKAGDEDIAEKIFTANKSYSKFKSLYGTNKYTGQNNAVEKILTQDELTPIQAVNTLFGKNIDGNAYTSQNLRRMIKSVEGTSREQAVKNNFRGGLLARAYEDATKRGDLSLANLKNNLIRMRRSESYKMNLATPEYDNAIDGLITDLGKVVDAQSRRDVYSPSAPLIMRSIGGIFDKLGYVIPSARVVSSGLDFAGKAAAQRPKAKALEKSIQEVFDEARKAMEKDFAIYGAPAGGIIGGQASQSDMTGDENN